MTESALRQIYSNPIKRDKIELYMNIYTFVKNFVVSDIDSYLTPTNVLYVMEAVGVSSDVLDNLEATDDGGLVINLKAIADDVRV